jgi:ATP-dependent Lon protease
MINNNESLTSYPLLPVKNLVVFPHTIFALDFKNDKSIFAIETAMAKDNKVLLAIQKDPKSNLMAINDFYDIGVIAEIKQMYKESFGDIRIVLENTSRAKIKEVKDLDDYFEADLISIESDPVLAEHSEIKAYYEQVKKKVVELRNLFDNKRFNPEFPDHYIDSVTNPIAFVDIVSFEVKFEFKVKLKLLETIDIIERYKILFEELIKKINIISLEKDIEKKAKYILNADTQKALLRQKMKVISNELDEKNEDSSDKEKLEKLNLSESSKNKVLKEIERLSQLYPQSSEYMVARTYIDTIFSLPWNKKADSDFTIKNAFEILGKDHYGLDDVKERVIEFLSVMKITDKMKSPVLCFVGPPGTGKTSIAKSIARALDKKYVRYSLGGVSDEAEIRGHRRTYVGAMPGRIISGIIDAGENNPVFLLDEIDKLGDSYKGDPYDALLELFDPEQNKYFSDHYLEIPFDFSEVLFITTANSLQTIPAPLLDRMEVIEITGYTQEEKMQIAKKYLIPKRKNETGLQKVKLKFPLASIKTIIAAYTRESGVRDLDKKLGKIMNKIAKEIVEKAEKRGKVDIKKNIKSFNLTVDKKKILNYLGKEIYQNDEVVKKKLIGVVNGLAWTTVGGTILELETLKTDGKGKVNFTGQLGEVMKESAEIAISYIKFLLPKTSVKKDFFSKNDIHIHAPEGAVKKDGPSAGITLFTAILSCITNTKIRQNIAMTGEITLLGKILPVGGIKEKVLAAFRVGIKEIILPKKNEQDLSDIPEEVKKKIKFHLIENAKEVIKIAFTKDPFIQ